MRKIVRFLSVCILLSAIPVTLVSQPDGASLKVIADLASPGMHGRGYVKKGDARAAIYLVDLFKSRGLAPHNGSYLQSFPIRVNTFPGKMELDADGIRLQPAVDYLVDPSSPGIRGTFAVVWVPVRKIMQFLAAGSGVSGKPYILAYFSDSLSMLASAEQSQWQSAKQKLLQSGHPQVAALLEATRQKLTFGTSTVQVTTPLLRVLARDTFSRFNRIHVNIRAKYLDSYTTANVTGWIRGSDRPDSVIVIAAHYDHLGRLGRETYFPGANDNASGVAMLLAVAEAFAGKPPRYSILFIAFSGEEAGLLGSSWYLQHSTVPLYQIRFMINLDLVGTGEEGIAVVNGSIHRREFSQLTAINLKESLVETIKSRGEACNSDHCPFHKAGVPSFFIYTLGGPKAYHDLDDRPVTLPLTLFEPLRKLLEYFVLELSVG